jgi:uncharacterized repeat protein (TIGR01451 family)
MFAPAWVQWLGRRFRAFQAGDRRRRRSAHRLRPRLEILEDRALPASLTLTPVADNTLYQDPAGQLSNGAGQHFYVGDTNQTTNDIRRGAIKFDLTAIPAGSTIQSATLTLHMSMSRAGPETVALHRALQNWGEGTSNAALGGTGSGEGDGVQATTGDVTWLYTFFNTKSWNTPGGDFVATASASTSVGGVGSYEWTGPGLSADVQQWVNNPATDFGWIVTGDETNKPSAKQFDTRENTTAANRPTLTITFVPVPDLSISKSHVGIFHPGDAADTYSVVVSNVGGAPTDGSKVTVIDTLPPGLSPTAADTGTVNGWSVSFSGQVVTATRSDVLRSGANYPVLTVTVSVAADVAATVTNTVTVSGGGDANPANNTATDPTATALLPDLTVRKNHSGSFRQGDAADTYTVTVHNAGVGPTVGTVKVTDTLPASLSPTAADNRVINGWSVSFSGHTITATRNDVLAVGASYPPLILTVSVAADAPASVTNSARVSGGGEADVSNDRAFDLTTILARADIRRRRGA